MRKFAPHQSWLGAFIMASFVFVFVAVRAFSMPEAGAQSSGVVVSEVMPANKTGLVDDDGDTSDWVELANTSSAPVDLVDWSLSDSASGAGEFVFPARVLAPGERLVVFASGKYRFGAGELHTNFKLNDAGDGVWLFTPAGVAVSGFDFGLFAPDTSIAAQPDGRLLTFDAPTPGGPNAGATLAPPRRPEFSVERGFYDAPFTVSMTTDPRTSIRYTTNGSVPTGTSPLFPSGGLRITKTTTLRVRAFVGVESSDVATATYVFVDEVLGQATMDPALLSRYGRTKVRDALLALPSVSIVTPTAIVEPEYRGTSMEWLDPEKGDTFQIDAGIKVFGLTSVNFEKQSMRLKFSREFGAPKLEFDLYSDFATAADTNGFVPTESFDQLQLRAGAQDSAFRPEGKALQIRNAVGDDTMLAMGIANPHNRFVHVYENGVYDGMYELRERFDSDFMAAYYGGDGEDYTAVNSGRAFDGEQSIYDQAVATTTWAGVSPYWDTKLLGDYFVYMAWNQTNDILAARNWMAAAPNEVGAAPKWIFHNNDLDYGFGNYADFNRPVKRREGPNYMFARLDDEMAPDWRMTIQQALWERLLAPDAILAPGGKHYDFYKQRISEVEAPIWAEGVRWHPPQKNLDGTVRGDWLVDVDWKQMVSDLENGYRTVAATDKDGVFYPATDLDDWWTERQEIVTAWVKTTYGFVYPPALSSCCSVSAGQSLQLAPTQTTGTIWYTIDGSDPRAAGGGVASGARGGATRPSLSLAESAVVSARVFDGTDWSPLLSWDVSVQGDTSPVVLNEWNAVPSSKLIETTDTTLGIVGGNGGDWFELVVVEDHADLRGYRLQLSEDGVPGAELVFTTNRRWADVRSGTIITVSEDIATDVSYDPAVGDWTLNVQASDDGPGTYITATNFAVSGEDWTLTIKNPSGAVVFGPAGEGVNSVTGIGSDETGELVAAPSATVSLAAYDDSSQSTFGAPNVVGGNEQNFAALRAVVPAPLPDVDADGVVDNRDVRSILENDVELGVPPNLFAGDIDRNTVVGLRDALRLAQCIAGDFARTCTVP